MSGEAEGPEGRRKHGVSVGSSPALMRRIRYTLSAQIFPLTPAQLIRVKASISHMSTMCQSLFILNESLTVSRGECFLSYSMKKLLNIHYSVTGRNPDLSDSNCNSFTVNLVAIYSPL